MTDTALRTAPIDDSASASLAGARVLVTGGTKGIGAAVAAYAAAAGAEVAVAARSVPAVGERAPGLRDVRFIRADVSTSQGVSALADEAMSVLGGVDVIVDNAGNPTHAPTDVLSMTDDDWLGDLQVNLLSAVRLDRALLPQMIERGSGVIVHMSSVVSRFPPSDVVPYAAAKAALNTYSKALSNEVAKHGIRVSTILPGLIETESMSAYITGLAREAGDDIHVARQRLVDGFAVPLGRLGRVEDVARLVVFLASPSGAYLTGGRYAVDGGMAPDA